jgi:hypothetical protein
MPDRSVSTSNVRAKAFNDVALAHPITGLPLGTTESPMVSQQVGLNGEPVDTSEPARVDFADNAALGVYTVSLANEILGPSTGFDTTGYGSLLVEVQQLTSGSIRAETSIDGVNRWTDLPFCHMDHVGNPGALLVMTATGKYVIPRGAKFIRFRKVSAGDAQIAAYGCQNYVAPVETHGTLAYTESTALLAAGATFTGSSRSSGATMGGPATRFRTYNVEVCCSHTATLEIQKSVDAGVTWVSVESAAVLAGVSKRLSTPVLAPNYRALLTNTAGTVQTSNLITSSFQE